VEGRQKQAGWAIAAFSFYPTKNLSAAGDAGMVTTNSDDVAERREDAAPARHAPPLLPRRVGWNARMDGFQGAILSVKLKYIEGWNQARRTVAKRYHALFRARDWPSPAVSHGVVLPHEVPGSRHVWHQYVIRTARRDELRDFLTARKIGSEIYYPVPLHMQERSSPRLQAKAAFPKPSAPRAKCWPCPSSPNCARTSSRRWWRRLRSF
jgi:dTDP-4-amino-4,6-dideoxygalactose transaminase